MYCLSAPDPPSATCSRSTETGPVNIFPFPSVRMICQERGRRDLPSSPDSFATCGLCPGQAPVACSSPWRPGPSSTSLHGFPVNSRVRCLCVNGFPHSLEAGFPARSSGRASQRPSAIMWAVVSLSPAVGASSLGTLS